MTKFFDINTLFFTIWGYPMSYLEFFGVVLGGVSTWLVARNNVWTWPVAVLSVVLFSVLFYQVQLYPDMFLQGFFFVTYLRGWWRWTHPRTAEQTANAALRITRMSSGQQLVWTLTGLGAAVLLGAFASNLHTWFPVLFSRPSAFPYLDSLTTVMSIIGTFLMIEKRVECWYVWLAVDLLLTYMYFVKGIKFVAAEYFVFCFIAAFGVWNWTREYRTYFSQTT